MIVRSSSIDSARLSDVRSCEPWSKPLVYQLPSARNLLTTHRSRVLAERLLLAPLTPTASIDRIVCRKPSDSSSRSLRSSRIYQGVLGVGVFFLTWYLLVDVFGVWRFAEMPKLVVGVKEWISRDPVFGVSLFTAEYYTHIWASIFRVLVAFLAATFSGKRPAPPAVERRPRGTWFLALGWVGIFVGLGVAGLGSFNNKEQLVGTGLLVSLISFGITTYPFALRELEARRRA